MKKSKNYLIISMLVIFIMYVILFAFIAYNIGAVLSNNYHTSLTIMEWSYMLAIQIVGSGSIFLFLKWQYHKLDKTGYVLKNK